MKLTAQLKLMPTAAQSDALTRTLTAANAAANYVSQVAWDTKTFKKFDLQKVIYHHIKGQFDLSAQLAIRVIAKVGDSYKLDKKSQRAFQPLGSVAFDDRILSYNLHTQTVSIWTLDGRLKIPFQAGTRQMELLQSRQGESDLAFHRGVWYVFATCDIPEPTPEDVDGVLGVDLGLIHIAVDSDGQTYSGQQIERKRQWYADRRAALQKVGSKSAKRRLKRLAGRQRRFQKDVNHGISKKVVQKAKDTTRAIAVEDLTHIRTRATVRTTERARLHNWSFSQQRQFLTYKALLAGVPVLPHNPAYSSQRCNRCGHISRNNRTTQACFRCIRCGHTALADVNAAQNLRDYPLWQHEQSALLSKRAAVKRPMVSTFGSGTSLPL